MDCGLLEFIQVRFGGRGLLDIEDLAPAGREAAPTHGSTRRFLRTSLVIIRFPFPERTEGMNKCMVSDL